MIAGSKVAVVVPAYCEELWIAEVLEGMPEFVDLVVVVDDASPDGTCARARAARCSAEVDIVVHVHNRGVGAAIASGYRRALERGADVVAVMAGDGQMDPADLRAVVEPVVQGEADYVKGNRLRHREVWRTMPIMRLLGSFVLSSLTALAVRQPLGDSQCGYTAIGRDVLQRIDLGAMWPRYGYPNDLLGLIAAAGGRILDVTVRPVYRGEASGMRPWHVATILYVIARAFRRTRARRGEVV